MALRINDKKIGRILINSKYPELNNLQNNDLRECITHVKPPYGKGFYREIYFGSVHIGFGHVFLSNKYRFDIETDFDSVEMHFTLKGKSLANSENFSGNINFESSQHNIIYGHKMSGQMEFVDQEIQILEINLDPEFFKRLLPAEGDIFNKFRLAIDKKSSSLIHEEHNRISLEMYQILNDIINCERAGIFKRMYLEAKVKELLVLQLEQFFKKQTSTSSISKKDEEKMYAVRDYITNNLNISCSLIDLAHHVGTNEYTLKKGFKALFGKTVFGFWNDAKMEYAKKMLLETDLNINEISDIVGYKNARHFSAAFKRTYNIAPSKVKGNKL